MDWANAITRVIELNTFANVWYWLAVIVSWSVASNWLIGVPFDMLFRARKFGTQQVADLEALVDINVRRIVAVNSALGLVLATLVAFILTGLLLLGFYYGVELAQGLAVLATPLTIIAAMNLRLALQLHEAPLFGPDLVRRMFFVRLWTQIISMVALFFTAMYGMYYTLSSQTFI